jgi:type VI secretion system protein ImpK
MPDSDDPFFRPDSTLMRPRPGGGKHAPGDATRLRPAPPMVADAEPIAPDLRTLLGVGLNPLVQAASPLLLLAGHLRTALSPMDVTGLRRHALEEIRRFEEHARSSSVPNDIVLAARYALCAGLDEAVLATPWGGQSEWAQHPLLVTLHREAWGGEKFFEMLDRIKADPSRYIDLMELQYLLLALGFAGKYHVVERGHERLAQIQQDLYRSIRAHRGTPPDELSLRWRGLEDRRNRLVRYVPWWVVGAAALAIIAVVFSAYYSRLASLAAPVHAELAKVGLEDFSAPAPAAPVKGPTLKQLLAPEEADGSLRVEETGGRTLITLLGADLFASGSVAVNPAYDRTLQRVAEALNKVPGRVLVRGHTDDQPIKSFRYQDNFALSRERAVSVATILQKTMENDARLSWIGVGSSEPRYRPESEPDNRSRNRRVEIVHVRGV